VTCHTFFTVSSAAFTFPQQIWQSKRELHKGIWPETGLREESEEWGGVTWNTGINSIVCKLLFIFFMMGIEGRERRD